MRCAQCGETIRTIETDVLGVKIVMMKPCRCKLLAEERDRLIQQSDRASTTPRMVDIPERYRDARFAAAGAGETEAEAWCRKYAENWPKMMESGRGVALWGPVGSGKTYLACCIANAAHAQGASVLYIQSATAATNAMQDVVASASKYDLLILDDLGAEAGTEHRQAVVDGIIDDRISSGKPIIITTNIVGARQQEMSAGLHGITAQRIWSRLAAMCVPIEVSGTDRRRAMRKATLAAMRSL